MTTDSSDTSIQQKAEAAIRRASDAARAADAAELRWQELDTDAKRMTDAALNAKRALADAVLNAAIAAEASYNVWNEWVAFAESEAKSKMVAWQNRVSKVSEPVGPVEPEARPVQDANELYDEGHQEEKW